MFPFLAKHLEQLRCKATLEDLYTLSSWNAVCRAVRLMEAVSSSLTLLACLSICWVYCSADFEFDLKALPSGAFAGYCCLLASTKFVSHFAPGIYRSGLCFWITRPPDLLEVRF